MPKVNVKQVLELSSKLFGGVDWDQFKHGEIQELIETRRLSVAHFEEFIRQGGRVPLEDIPVKVSKSWTVLFGNVSWEEMVAEARAFGLRSNIKSSPLYDSYVKVDTLLKPKDLILKPKVQVHLIEISNKERKVLASRMFELFKLLNMYPSTVPEAFAMINDFGPELPKDLVLLNASRKETSGRVNDLLLQKEAGKNKYHFSVIGGDQDDDDYLHDHLYYLATSYD